MIIIISSIIIIIIIIINNIIIIDIVIVVSVIVIIVTVMIIVCCEKLERPRGCCGTGSSASAAAPGLSTSVVSDGANVTDEIETPDPN